MLEQNGKFSGRGRMPRLHIRVLRSVNLFPFETQLHLWYAFDE